MAINPIQQAKDLIRKRGKDILSVASPSFAAGRLGATKTGQQIAIPVANTFIHGVNSFNKIGLSRYNPGISTAKRIPGFQNAPVAQPTSKDALNVLKAGLTGVGIARTPAMAISGGLFNASLNTIGNVAQRKPINQNFGSSVGQGALAGLMSGPIVAGSNPILSKIVNPVSSPIAGRIVSGGLNVTQGAGVNLSSGNQVTPGSVALDFAAGLAGGKRSFSAETANLFGRNKEFQLNSEELIQAQKVIRNKKAFSPQEIEEAKNAIYNLADRHLSPEIKDKFVGSPVKLAKALEKELNKPKPQVYPTFNRIVGDNPIQPKGVGEVNFDPKKYVDELTQKKADIKQGEKVGLVAKGKSFLADLKEKFSDSASPIEDALNSAEKKYKFMVRPIEDPRLQIDRVVKSKDLASQFVRDNGLENAIKNAPDLDMLDQYLIAKQATKVRSGGKLTGRDMAKDQKLIQALGPEYEKHAQMVTQYSKKLKDYMVQTGLISDKLSKQLDIKYPDYVPLNRVFTEMEKSGLIPPSTKQIASLSKQTVVQKLQGSEREIESPIESLLSKTRDAFNQGERNVAARQIAQLGKLPGMEGLFKELKQQKVTQKRISRNGKVFNTTVTKNEQAPHTISFLDGGVKKTFATTPEIEAAAKSLTLEQLGLIGKIINKPVRVLQLGATGINIPFVVRNMVKDEITGFINSNRAASTSIFNPVNYVKSLMSALKHDDLYQEVVRNAGAGTSFDIARLPPELSVKRIRASRKITSNALYKVTRPDELIRAVEDIVGRAEEFGRIKNYKGTYDALIKEGRTVQDAKLLAAKAARENTANFGRSGSWGRVLNGVVPFFNAGIQGSRQLVRSFQRDPVGTGAKMVISVFTPVATATAWNLSDPTRKQIYQDLPASEKENNIIIIPPDPTQNERGLWNVIKIPIPPGLSNLSGVVRKTLEGANGLDPVKFQDIASALVAASTSIDPSDPRKAVNSVIPQGLKLVAEPLLNKNFYTGNEIVPTYMKDRPAEFQAFDDTSGTARGIGKALNVSPLKVENFIRTASGGLGSQLMNISDRIGNAAGVVPDNQVGGEGPIANVKRSFSASYGGQISKNARNELSTYRSYRSQLKKLVESGDTERAKQFVLQNKEVFTRGPEVERRGKAVEKLEDAKKKIKAANIDPQKKAETINKLNMAIIQLGGVK